MPSKIVLVPNGQADIDIATDMAPRGFDLVITQPNSAEFRAAVPDMKYLIGLGDA